MKAKYFKKIRSQVKYFVVQRSEGLFGKFWRSGILSKILARSHEEAVIRFRRKEERRYMPHEIIRTDEEWAKYKVYPVGYERLSQFWK